MIVILKNDCYTFFILIQIEKNRKRTKYGTKYGTKYVLLLDPIGSNWIQLDPIGSKDRLIFRKII
jgi:hypothetical protein